MKKLVFFNQYHNGDLFVGKNWVRNLVQQLPEYEFEYAHTRNPETIKDLGIKQITFAGLPELNNMWRIAQDGDTIYLNTWCGAFQGEVFPFGSHSNYIVQHRIYELYCDMLSQVVGRKITQSTNPHDYLPEIDFTQYDRETADRFAQNVMGSKHTTLFCNSDAMSGQSQMNDMTEVINALAKRYPDNVFIVTKPIDKRSDNIYYTGDIFNKECDVNEIAYLSTYCRLIVGKNGGPYTYCQFKENMNDSRKTFFCFGLKLTDCLNAGLEFPAQFKFSDQIHPNIVANMLARAIENPDSGKTGMQHITV